MRSSISPTFECKRHHLCPSFICTIVPPLNYRYHFIFLCVQLNENDFKVLVVTEDSSVVLNQLQVNEQGTYRCSLQDQNGTVFYRATFLLTGESSATKYTRHLKKIVRWSNSEWIKGNIASKSIKLSQVNICQRWKK